MFDKIRGLRGYFLQIRKCCLECKIDGLLLRFRCVEFVGKGVYSLLYAVLTESIGPNYLFFYRGNNDEIAV